MAQQFPSTNPAQDATVSQGIVQDLCTRTWGSRTNCWKAAGVVHNPPPKGAEGFSKGKPKGTARGFAFGKSKDCYQTTPRLVNSLSDFGSLEVLPMCAVYSSLYTRVCELASPKKSRLHNKIKARLPRYFWAPYWTSQLVFSTLGQSMW